MANAYFNVPIATNEPVKGYAPGSKEKEELLAAYKELKSKKIEIPMVIGGKTVTSDAQVSIHPPSY